MVSFCCVAEVRVAMRKKWRVLFVDIMICGDDALGSVRLAKFDGDVSVNQCCCSTPCSWKLAYEECDQGARISGMSKVELED